MHYRVECARWFIGRAVYVAVLIVVVAIIGGCSDVNSSSNTGSSKVPVADPAGRGPFGVGVWESRIEELVARDGTVRPLPMYVWYPTDAEGEVDATLKGIIDAPASDAGPFPVVAFSHGWTALLQTPWQLAAAQSVFLMEHMASHGFVVVAIGHPDTEQGRGESFTNRPGEVRAAVTYVVEESAREGALLHGAVDGSRSGVMGHSFGGLTTLAVLAETDNPFLAGIAMAPGIRPGDSADVSDDLPQIIHPVMMMMGEKDILARFSNLTTAYATLPDATVRYAFIFPNGNHDAYLDTCLVSCSDEGSLDLALGHQLINTYATTFMQVYVAGQTEFDEYLQQDEDIADGEARLIEYDLE